MSEKRQFWIPIIAGVIVTVFPVQYLARVFYASRPVVPAEVVGYCFVPFLVALGLYQYAFNLRTGRFLLSPPRPFSARTRARIGRVAYAVEICAAVATACIMLVRAFAFFPRLSEGVSLEGSLTSHVHSRVLLDFLHVRERTAIHFMLSHVWDWLVILWLLVALFVLYRKHAESVRQAWIRTFYSHLIHLSRRVHSDVTDEGAPKAGVWEQEARGCLKILLRAISSDPLQRLIRWSLRSSCTAYVLVPTKAKNKEVFEILAGFSDDEVVDDAAQDLKKVHRPRALDLSGLVELYNECARRELNGQRCFDKERFESAKDAYLSAVGVVYRLERPKIFHVARWCMAFSREYTDWAKAREQGTGKRLRLGSFVVIPLKLGGRVLGIVFVGASRPFGFVGADVHTLERLGRAMAEAVLIGDEAGAITLASGEHAGVLIGAKPCERPDVKQNVRRTLRELGRAVAKGGSRALPAIG